MAEIDKNLREERIHGSSSFPCAYYQAKDVEVGGPLDVPHHWHELLEIIYLERGRFLYQKNMDVYEIDQPCFLLINSGSLHRLYAEGKYLEHAVVFSPEMLSFVLSDLAEDKIIRPFISGQLHFPERIDADDSLFYAFVSEFLSIAHAFQIENLRHGEQYNAAHAFSQLTIKTSLLKMLGLLYESGRFGMEDAAKEEMTEIMKRVLLYVEENYSISIRLDDLAGIAGLNAQYFCRQFKKFFGESPMKYLLNYRLRKAGRLLVDSDLSVTDVALACGFQNLGHFMTEFKKITGKTPTRYRKDSR